MPPYSPQRSPRKNNVYNKPYSPSKSPTYRTNSIKSPIALRSTTFRSNVTSPKRRVVEEHNLHDSKSITLEEYLASKEKGNNSKNEINRSQIRLKPHSNDEATASRNQKIRVCVRKRPLNKSEISSKEEDITQLSGMRTINIFEPKLKLDLTQYTEQHSFTFDEVFDHNSSSKTIYQKTTWPLVEYMFEGGKSTCFAFGQTGSGKTYTMLDSKHGLYTQTVKDIFRLLNEKRHVHLSTWVGYYEIYQGHLYDLLGNRKKLIPRDDGKGNVVIAGLKELQVHDVYMLLNICEYGNRERTTNKTATNQASSRSHAILQLCLKNNDTIHGKLNFIDLAGSERGTDRGKDSDAKVRMEGAEINRSLLALKECIRALDQDRKRAPFRGSKLTMVLRDSFIGNSKTCMIATISPNASNSDHTLNTLKYADRIKEFRGESDSRLAYSDVQDMPNIEAMNIKTTNIEAMDVEATDIEAMEVEESPNKDKSLPQITKDHIKNFLDGHRAEIDESEEYLTLAKNMLYGIDLTNVDSYEFFSKYQNYLKGTNVLLRRKIRAIQSLQNKIKDELCSDDE